VARLYLVIVRYDPDLDIWVIDEDSRHILEDDGGNYPTQELQVRTIRAVGQDGQ
jgi:hypothetical protein